MYIGTDIFRFIRIKRKLIYKKDSKLQKDKLYYFKIWSNVNDLIFNYITRKIDPRSPTKKCHQKRTESSTGKP